MARSTTKLTVQGTDYTINDPNIAPEFDAAEEYPAGKYVNNQGDLFRLPDGHTAGTAWADTTKTKVLVDTEIRTLNNGTIRKRDTLIGVDLNTVTTPGMYWHGSAHAACTNTPEGITSADGWILMVVTGSSNNAYQTAQYLMQWGMMDHIYYRIPAMVVSSEITWNKWQTIDRNSIAAQKYNQVPTTGDAVTVLNGSYSKTGVFTESASYKTYVYQAQNNCFCYFRNTAAYHSLCIFESNYPESGSFVSPRYRHDGDGEGNYLPTWNSQKQILAGRYIAVTVRATDITTSCYINDTALGEGLELNPDILLNDTQIEQVRAGTNAKVGKLEYYGAGTNNGVYVYMPTGKGYLRYNFSHAYNTEKNCDTWRIGPLYAVDDTLAPRFAATTNGEWECAVHLQGRPDFSGGIQHGNEVTTALVFMIDGTPYSANEVSGLGRVEFRDLRIIEVSNLYDPSATSTVAAIHRKEYRFEGEKLILRQNVAWQISDTATVCYLAMCTPAQEHTDRIYFDNDITPQAVADAYGYHPNVRKMTQYSDLDGFMCSMEITKYPTGLTGGDTALVTDNSGGSYNKMYFVVCTEAAITDETQWDTETVYEFNIGEPKEA